MLLMNCISNNYYFYAHLLTGPTSASSRSRFFPIHLETQSESVALILGKIVGRFFPDKNNQYVRYWRQSVFQCLREPVRSVYLNLMLTFVTSRTLNLLADRPYLYKQNGLSDGIDAVTHVVPRSHYLYAANF